MWKAQNEKIEQSLSINRKLLMETINQKAETSLRSLKRLNIVSFSAIFFINLRGFVDYIKHLTWANNIDYNGSAIAFLDYLLSE